MSRYLLLFRNDAEGAARMMGGLVEGFAAFPETVERFGGKAEGLWAVAGRYDAAAVVTFEKSEGLLAFCLTATAQGQQVEALNAYSAEDVAHAADLASGASQAFAAKVAELLNEDGGTEAQA